MAEPLRKGQALAQETIQASDSSGIVRDQRLLILASRSWWLMRIPLRFGWFSIVGARIVARGIDQIFRKPLAAIAAGSCGHRLDGEV